jgi:hypothetical protein
MSRSSIALRTGKLFERIFARPDRQIRDQLPIDLLAAGRLSTLLGMNDCQRQAGISLLLADRRLNLKSLVSDVYSGIGQFSPGVADSDATGRSHLRVPHRS